MLESQEKADATLKKFQDLLRQLFQFDSADLDFGIYRILNYKRREIDEFIAHRLPQIVKEDFKGYAQTERESLQKRIEETKKKILENQKKILENLGKEAFDEQGQLVKFHETRLGEEYTALLEEYTALLKELAHYQISEDLKIRIYNDLYTFFSRYYEDGDFIAKRRYGRDETYAIPYNGEEVVLHWATKDQYYIKTGERFKNYRFKVKISTRVENATEVQEYTVAFELRSAKTEQNNNKGEKRYFVLASDSPVVLDPETKTLTVFFEYRPLNEAEQKEFGRTEQQKPQDNLNKKAANAILELLRDLASKDPKASEDSRKELEDLKAQLEKPEAANEQSRLMKHLTRFTRRNTSDFFIHKDLRGFLRRELDFFIKSQSLLLDELLAQEENLTHQHIQRARVVRDIGYKIIDFLAQVENFQKRLFEKKKLVISTEYCITIGRVPEDLWGEVLQNNEQLAEWRELYGVDPQPTEEFLRQHPTLVVDTRYFSEDFKWCLLERFEDLDEALDGVLIKSENFQALNLLLEKYRGKVKCIYIDPPFNTGTNEFLYKNNYLDSSWITMINDRLLLGKSFLSNSGGIYFRIDYHGDHYAHYLLDAIFGKQNFRNEIVVKRTKTLKGEAKRFHVATDTVFLYALDEAHFDFKGFKKPKEKPEWVRMHLPGTVKKNPERVFFGKKLLPPPGRKWVLSQEAIDKAIAEGRIKWDDQLNEPLFLTEHESTGSDWTDIPGYSSNWGFTTENSEELLHRAIATVTVDKEWVMDYFLGSGTTTAVAQKMGRRWIGVESGEHFESHVLPRMKKVLFGEQSGISSQLNWQGGGFFKYLYLEQYEDTLNNLELPREQEGQLALERFGDEYLLRYMLDFETQGSPSLLNLDHFQDPFAYKLKVQEGDEIRERVVDLVETFNYLLGIHVKKMRQCRYKERLYRAVLGEKDGKRIVIVWRPLKGLNGDTRALQRDRKFIQCIVLPALLGKGKKPDRLLVNGICYVPDAEPIEPEFKRLMWKEGKDGQEAQV
jgi:adenine-specific DNA-methyltransferase